MKKVTRSMLVLAAVAAAGTGVGAEDGSTTRGELVVFAASFINKLEAAVFATVSLFGVDVEWVVLWMGLPMFLLTAYFGFINLRGFPQAWRVIRGDYRDDSAPGEVTQFQALTTALSGTVGIANISGAAVAISIGGPGATFWMIVIGLFAMSLKFAECTLGVKYRETNCDGTISGGPMYYLDKGLAARGWGRLGKILAWSYAFFAIFTLGQLGQVNQSFEALSAVTGLTGQVTKWGYGLLMAALTAVVIVGGIQSIARVTSRLVPVMAGLYLVAALAIIIVSASQVPGAIATIFEGAFTGDGVSGGLVGVLVVAMRRAVYSTEAGLGSATIAHAAAKTREPVSEGFVALMEPFIDTVVISTLTALVIVITGAYLDTNGFGGGSNLVGVSMTSTAFGSVFSWFPWVLALAAFLFAFSTIISWGYYCSKIWEFLFGSGRWSMGFFKSVYCVALVPGAVLTAGEVFGFLDSLFFLMAIPNVIGIYFMAPELKSDLSRYLAHVRKERLA